MPPIISPEKGTVCKHTKFCMRFQEIHNSLPIQTCPLPSLTRQGLPGPGHVQFVLSVPTCGIWVAGVVH